MFTGPACRRFAAGPRPLVLPIVIAATVFAARPARALPEFARIYHTSCQTCHSTVPKLNATGLAFQADHFNFTGGLVMARDKGLRAIPLSGLATFSYEDQRNEGGASSGSGSVGGYAVVRPLANTGPSGHDITTAFRSLILFSADGFSLAPQRYGGYFVAGTARANPGGSEGALADAYASVPLVGSHGQLALTAGQFTPMLYQWDPLNSLTQTLPAAIADSIDGFSFASAVPGVRLDYFDHRGTGTGDGLYISGGVPFGGQLQLNHLSRVNNEHGLFATGFERRGVNSLGLFGYTHDGNNLGGVLATQDVATNLHLLGIAAIGHDVLGETRRASVQADYTMSWQLALSLRTEVLAGTTHDTGEAAAVTFYPIKLQALRLRAEIQERRADRVFQGSAILQF